ncbi:MAG: hypothetical protein ACP5OC_02200 [Thermoplasmata archaeon]|jgi:hypothetical protein
MGRTTPTARQSIERIAESIEKMCSLMNSTDARIARDLVAKGRKRSAEISFSAIDPETGFILALLLEIEKEILSIRERT